MAQLPAGHVPLTGSWFGWLKRPPRSIDTGIWTEIRRSVPLLQGLDATRDAALQSLVARFLHEKTITPLAGLVLDAPARMQLAALCCLPLIGFGEKGLRGWSQLLVYPDAFRVQRSHLDAAGVLHEFED
ncbi:MAG: zinc-dependent peptidase, partial [Pseudoxanthomonas sp.]